MKLTKFKLTFKKAKKSYHQNSSTVLQFSSVQFVECQYKVKTIVISARQIGHLRPSSWTRLAQSTQILWWPHGTSATRGLWGAIRHTDFPHFHVSYFHVSLFPYCFFMSRTFMPRIVVPHFHISYFHDLHFWWCRNFISRIFSRPVLKTAGY